MSTRKHSNKKMGRDQATDYQHKLIHEINEIDRIRGEYNKEMNLAKKAHERVESHPHLSDEQKHEHKIYEHHASESAKLRRKINEHEDHIKNIVETLTQLVPKSPDLSLGILS